MYSSIVSTINNTCVCGRLIQELKYVNRKSDQVTLAMSDAETKAGSPRENVIKMWVLGALWVYIALKARRVWNFIATFVRSFKLPSNPIYKENIFYLFSFVLRKHEIPIRRRYFMY